MKISKHLWTYFLLFSLCLSSDALACSCRAPISSVKANMHTWQTMLETYAIDHKRYPASVEDLRSASQAASSPYWKNATNPFMRRQGILDAYMNLSDYTDPPQNNTYIWGLRIYLGPLHAESNKGMVVYEYVNPLLYYIYGTDKHGMFLKDRGREFVLSNA